MPTPPRIIDEEESALYQRQSTLGLEVPLEAFVVGCGGTGTWTSILLAMIGVKTIHLSDDDIIEIHNLSRLPFSKDSCGRPKTEVLKEYLINLRPECTVITHEGIHTEADMINLSGIVFDCNDDFKMQKLIYEFCKKYSLKYISVGCNANHITVTSAVECLWGTEIQDRYQVTPIFVIPPIIAACCTIWNITKRNTHIDLLLPINKMFVEPFESTTISEECKSCGYVNECEGCLVHGCEAHKICNCCPIDRTV